MPEPIVMETAEEVVAVPIAAANIVPEATVNPVPVMEAVNKQVAEEVQEVADEPADIPEVVEDEEEYITHTFRTGVTVRLRPISPIVIEMMQTQDVPPEPSPPKRTVKQGQRIIEGEPDFENDSYKLDYARWERNVNRATGGSTKEMLNYVAAVSLVDDPPAKWYTAREEFIKSYGHGRMLYLEEQMFTSKDIQDFFNSAVLKYEDEEEEGSDVLASESSPEVLTAV